MSDPNSQHDRKTLLPPQLVSKDLVDRAWQDGLKVGWAIQVMNHFSETLVFRMTTIAHVAIAVRKVSLNTRNEILRTYLIGIPGKESPYDAMMDAADNLDRAVKDYGPLIESVDSRAINRELISSLNTVVGEMREGIFAFTRDNEPDNGKLLYRTIDKYSLEELMELGRAIVKRTPKLGRPEYPEAKLLRQMKAERMATLGGQWVKMARDIINSLKKKERDNTISEEERAALRYLEGSPNKGRQKEILRDLDLDDMGGG